MLLLPCNQTADCRLHEVAFEYDSDCDSPAVAGGVLFLQHNTCAIVTALVASRFLGQNSNKLKALLKGPAPAYLEVHLLCKMPIL